SIVMLRCGIALVTLAALAGSGCDSDGGGVRLGAGGSSMSTERAAFAAKAAYPKDAKPNTDMKVTALVGHTGNKIKIVNASDKPLSDVTVWVNGQYATHAAVIAPSAVTTLDRADFFDANGLVLSNTKAINKVEL